MVDDTVALLGERGYATIPDAIGPEPWVFKWEWRS